MKQYHPINASSSGSNKITNRLQPLAEEKIPDYPTGMKIANSGSSRLVGESKDTLAAIPTKKISSGYQQTPKKRRRNSTGTIYISTTMSKQNNDATIECCCVVIRAHMLSAAKENIVPLSEYDIFKDAAFIHKQQDYKDANPMSLVPTLATVKEFFTLIFSKSQLESDCIIMALIYCERLVKETKGRLCIRYDNWRSM